MYEVEFETMLGEAEVRVVAECQPGDPGNPSGPPEKCWPAEPAQVASMDVFLRADGSHVEVDGDEYEQLAEEALQAVETAVEADYIDRRLDALRD